MRINGGLGAETEASEGEQAPGGGGAQQGELGHDSQRFVESLANVYEVCIYEAPAAAEAASDGASMTGIG